MPEECSPLPDTMICVDKTLHYPEAGGLVCFKPEEIAPFLEQCGERGK